MNNKQHVQLTKVTDYDFVSAEKDKYGVFYSRDGLRLIHEKSIRLFADLKMIRTFAPLSTESTSDKEVLERWQSGRLRRS